MVTPVDFHTDDNMLSNWTRGMDVDLFVDTLGNVPADLMNLCYLTLKPWRLFAQKYVGLVDILDDKRKVEDFLRMEKLIFDSPAQAGRSEEHTSELQSLIRISYALFCLKKKKKHCYNKDRLKTSTFNNRQLINLSTSAL